MQYRDELRPRFGLLRAREFLMKDAYSFHLDHASLEETYQEMYDAYSRIFDRIGLTWRAVLADTGNIGGSGSHEFHVLAEITKAVLHAVSKVRKQLAAKKTPLVLSAQSRKGVPEALRALLEVIDEAGGSKALRPRDKAPAFLADNPLGTVPLLVDGAVRMTESAAIGQYRATT